MEVFDRSQIPGGRVFARKILKVLVHSPPPLKREGFVRTVRFRIPEVTLLSIQKEGCENYLFVYVLVRRVWAALQEEGKRGRFATSQTVGNGLKPFPTKNRRQRRFSAS
jgi:hypothetical protein